MIVSFDRNEIIYIFKNTTFVGVDSKQLLPSKPMSLNN